MRPNAVAQMGVHPTGGVYFTSLPPMMYNDARLLDMLAAAALIAGVQLLLEDPDFDAVTEPRMAGLVRSAAMALDGLDDDD